MNSCVESWGPKEKFVDRIKELSEGYGDGLDVIKELIQNSDDAGASEMKICLDLRPNAEWKKKLFTPQLTEVQNDCFWIYNNAEFKDEDFENLVRVGAKHKVRQTGVIGRFGLGFNSVYNITDIPFILSRQKLGMFDPNFKYLTKDWLKEAKLDENEPGIKFYLDRESFDRQKNVYSDQFQPFNEIFGCKIFEKNFDFKGTIFRLPFRKSPSEISNNLYTEERVRKFFKIFFDYSENLLLFTQHLCKLEIFTLFDGQDPKNMNLAFKIEKSLVRPIRSHDIGFNLNKFLLNTQQSELIKQSSILRVAGHLINSQNNDLKQISTSFIQKITVSYFDDLFFSEFKKKIEETYWFQMLNCFPRPDVFGDQSEFQNYLPCTGISINLVPSANEVSKFNLNEDGIQGLAFCFLPLSRPTNFKFHINANFLLTTTREWLYSDSKDRIDHSKSNWNELLKKYLASTLIECCEEMNNFINYDFLSLLNLLSLKSDSDFGIFEKVFIKSIFDYEKKLSIFQRNGIKYSIDRCKILRLGFDNDISSAAHKIFQALEGDNYYVLNLPSNIWKFLDLNNISLQNIVNEEIFSKKFLENIDMIDCETRINMIKYLLKEYSFDSKSLNLTPIGCLIKGSQCIPTNLTGTLKRANELINKFSKISELFDYQKDDVFPNDEIMNDNKEILLKMGLIDQYLPSSIILERINVFLDDLSVRFTCWDLLNSYLITLVKEEKTAYNLSFQYKIRDQKFIKPKERSGKFAELEWFSDTSGELASLAELYSEDYEMFVFRIKPVFDSQKIKAELKPLISNLGLRKNSNDDTVQQFKLIKSEWEKLADEQKIVDGEYLYTYFLYFIEWLNKNYGEKTFKQSDLKLPLNMFFLKVNKIYGYFSPENIALDVKYPSTSYIIKLPDEVASKVSKKLLGNLGVQQCFNDKTLLKFLRQIYDDYHDSKLNEDLLQVCLNIINELHSNYKIETMKDEIFLPDTNNILRLPEDLCFYDETAKSINHVINKKVSIDIAEAFGIMKAQIYNFKHLVDINGFEFGQREPLVARINKLLALYPNFFDIFKELIQNADDAGASEIAFILDDRNHSKENIFPAEFAALQGPAVCCYNNAKFTEENFQALRTLGVGSKENEKFKVGKYGVGFNVVYHLTDAPQLLSNLDNYLMFDPLCKHVPDLKSNGFRLSAKKENENCLKDYSGVLESFLGYFDSHDKLRKGSMFRLALRKDKSKISSSVLTIAAIEEKIRQQAFDLKNSLVFLKNIRKLSVTKIKVNNQVETILDFEKKFDKKVDENEHEQYMKHFMNSVGKDVADLRERIFEYNITISDSNDKPLNFKVINQIGFENKITLSINFESHFPLASIAIPTNIQLHQNFRSSLYCFLPLSVPSPMPYHINAYFALNNESRQALYKVNDMKNEKLAWNQVLFSDIITNLMFKALKYVKSNFELEYLDEPNLIEDHYVKFFPSIKLDNDIVDTKIYMEDLVKNFYEKLKICDDTLIPLQKEQKLIDWVSIKDEDLVSSLLLEKFFSENKEFTAETYERLCNILLQFGLKMCVFNKLVKELNQAHSTLSLKLIKDITPQHIANFFKKKCNLNGINIKDTFFKNEKNLASLLRFCKLEIYKKDFDDVPLLLNATNKFQPFSMHNLIFEESEYKIFENCYEKFIHPSFIDNKELSLKSFTKKLGIKDLKEFLPYGINETKYFIKEEDTYRFEKYPEVSRSTHMTNKLLNENKLNIIWKILDKILDRIYRVDLYQFEMKKFCTFITTIDNIRKNTDINDDEKETLLEIFSTINQWAILPVKFPKSKSTCLAPISAANLILNTDRCPNRLPAEFMKFFDECNLPTVASLKITNDIYKWIVVDLSQAIQILQLLERLCKLRPDAIQHLDRNTRNKFLNYLVESQRIFENEATKSKLLSLPIFENALGDVLSLENKNIILIDNDIPISGLGKIFSNKKYFLALKDEELKNVYKVLNCDSKSFAYFYDQYLPELNSLDYEEQKPHILAIKSKFHENKLTDSILQKLAGFKFILTKTSEIHAASNFYEPNIKTFEILFRNSNAKMLPKEYHDENWLKFLVAIGLKGKSSLNNIETINGFLLLLKESYERKELGIDEFILVLKQLYEAVNSLEEENLTKILDRFQESFELLVNIATNNFDKHNFDIVIIDVFNELYKILTKLSDSINSDTLVSRLFVRIQEIDILLHKNKSEKWRLDRIEKFVEYNLSKSEEIENFLYVYPENFSEHKKLFSQLGLNEEVNYEFCMKLLTKIYFRMEVINSSENYTEGLVFNAIQAMHLLFKCAAQTRIDPNLEVYLLNGAFQLRRASDLFYIDKPGLRHLYRSNVIKEHCLVSLEVLSSKFPQYITYENKWYFLLNRLNFEHQPKPISTHLTTDIVTDSYDVIENYVELEEKVHNQVFISKIIALLIQDDEYDSEIENYFMNIKIYKVDKLRTRTYFFETIIENQELNERFCTQFDDTLNSICFYTSTNVLFAIYNALCRSIIDGIIRYFPEYSNKAEQFRDIIAELLASTEDHYDCIINENENILKDIVE